MEMNTSKRQIMGLAFSPDWLNHPDHAIPALERTRDGGFGTILGFVRHMHHTVTHEHVRRAVRRTAENCHKQGLKFALDMDWAHWVDEYVELYPEMAQWTAVRGEVVVQAPAGAALTVVGKPVACPYDRATGCVTINYACGKPIDITIQSNRLT